MKKIITQNPDDALCNAAKNLGGVPITIHPTNAHINIFDEIKERITVPTKVEAIAKDGMPAEMAAMASLAEDTSKNLAPIIEQVWNHI